MALDSSFCMAYDRRPMSFSQSGYSSRGETANRPFHDLMHDLQELRLSWQTISSTEPLQLLEKKTLEGYIDSIGAIDHRACRAIGLPQQATQIPARIEQLFYGLHMSYFTAQVHGLAAVSTNISPRNRLRSFQHMKDGLRQVISSFMTLRQLSAVPNVAWE